eukprot:7618391-Alexandrium_andersonii.AAC.1
MSASLVGSEMCIRDRIHQRTTRVEGRAFTSRSWQRAEEARGQWGDTVSYTHLTLPTICSV